eukprot:8452004-Alexandrium_andersonii.AAC.1
MSASLVGSEMCIRDRVPPSASSGSGPSGSPRGVGGEERSRPMPPPSAVSYTHLTLPTICSV